MHRSTISFMSMKQTFASSWWILATGFVYSIVIFARGWAAIDRIGADTGYTYVPDAVNENLWVLFKPFPEYFEISGRAAAELVAIFPIRYHAIASSAVVNFIWVGLGLFIYAIISQETHSKMLSSLAGLALIVTPHASESSIGNIGMIKFPLTAAVAIAFCSSRAIIKYPKMILVVALVAGLSQPILLVISLPLLWFLRSKDRELRQKVSNLLIVVCGTFIMQIFKVGLGKAVEGRSGSSVKSLWPGMGLFWYSGIFFPTIFVLSIMALDTFDLAQFRRFKQIRYFLCISTIALTVSCFILGGIADRYFVAPMTLAWICGILLIVDFIHEVKRLRVFAITTAIIFAAVPVAKWFGAGWYLTSGPTWTSQIDQAEESCIENPKVIIELRVSPSGYSEVTCSQLAGK